MNLMSGGELRARSLGVDVERVRITLFLCASVFTATAVVLAGTIGFVGLVVPHMIRLAAGGDHRGLLPASALAGGTLVVCADTVARTVIAPQQLPVGVVTALIGVPIFLVLLRKTLTAGAP
jgi:iron complex transport system permease protein